MSQARCVPVIDLQDTCSALPHTARLQCDHQTMPCRDGLHPAAEYPIKHVTQLAFSHSGAQLAAAGGSRLIGFVDTLSLRLVRLLKVGALAWRLGLLLCSLAQGISTAG